MLSKPVEHRTTHSFQQTLDAVVKAIAEAGLTIFHQIDHAKAAAENGLSMPETRVVVYGNPRAGTPVMVDTPLSALDLPLRVLVRELPGSRSAIAFRPVSDEFEALGVKIQAASRFDEIQHSIAEAARGAAHATVHDARTAPHI